MEIELRAGATLDLPSTKESEAMFDRLERRIVAALSRTPLYRRPSDRAVADGNGIAEIALGAPPDGFEWEFMRYTINGEDGVTAVAGSCGVWIGGEQGQRSPLRFVESTPAIPAVSVWAADQLVIGYGERLVFRFSGVVATTVVFCNAHVIERRIGSFAPEV